MATTLTIRDETPSGEVLREFTLQDLAETITARELLRARVYQEVQDYNQSVGEKKFTGLIKPSATEERLNGKKPEARKIDWERQFEKACEAFLTNGFFIIVGDTQVEDLESTITVEVDTAVSFVKLTPLVGGQTEKHYVCSIEKN
ncbi:MAG: hypothetical protein ACPG32_00210 [Akkermansiaceae bacterium]